MEARDAGRLRAWLADPRVADVDPPTVERLRASLAGGPGAPLIAVEPHGTVVVRERSRRVLELDRDGSVLSVLRWTEEGRLARAWTRIADDSWVMIEPRAAREAPWGVSDRLWHAPHPSASAPAPLTVFEALAYERIDRIPTLAEPARLPPGAGVTVLNLVAALAADASRSRLAYRGPYPTEQLFLALLESFRYETAEADPLAAFVAGRVTWSPAPHERVRPGAGVTAHLRGRVETVAWRGRTYHRTDWQGVHRHAPRRVRDADGTVMCSLWALGGAVADHLRLDREATTVEVIAPPPRTIMTPSPLPPAVLAGLASAAAALGAPPLAPFIRSVAAPCALAWAPLDADLVAVDGARLLVAPAFRDVLERRLRAATTRAQRLGLGLAALTELAHLFGDTLRARAQQEIAALPPATQAHVLSTPPAGPEGDDARRITAAVEALLTEISTEPDAPH